MSYKLVEWLAYLVGIPAIIGLIRIKRISQVYFPFILLLWVGLASEIVTTVLINRGLSNALSSNIYVLLESVLILFFFERMDLFKSRQIFYLLLFLFAGGWIVENFVLLNINRFNSYFRIGYSFIVVLLSINLINRLMLQERTRMLRNPVFLIMIGFIVFFTYKALIEIFWVYGFKASDSFKFLVYRIMTYINLSANIVFTIAVLWIPRKQEFTLQ